MVLYLRFKAVICRTYFFLQAEDGIRVRNVTGVQTCALPISRRRLDTQARAARKERHPPARRPVLGTGRRAGGCRSFLAARACVSSRRRGGGRGLQERSAERRVGKEGVPGGRPELWCERDRTR